MAGASPSRRGVGADGSLAATTSFRGGSTSTEQEASVVTRRRGDTQDSGPATSQNQPKQATAGILDNFSQQKLRAWQPVLTPRWIVVTFIVFGIVFEAIGERE